MSLVSQNIGSVHLIHKFFAVLHRVDVFVLRWRFSHC